MRDRLKHLGTGVAIYGAGDAVIQIVNFFLLPVYVRFAFLTTADFGALALIGAIEAFSKVINRWGLDGAFMRYYHERDEGRHRQVMTSTIIWFMVVANGTLLAITLLASGRLARMMSLGPEYLPALRLMLVNIALVAFTFVPFHVMRLRHEAAVFSMFTFARSVGTVVLRILFVIGLRYGVAGVYLSDLLLTLVLLPLMWPRCRTLVAAAFSTRELRTVLRFGLPRLPHGLASQTLDGYPKLLLGRSVSPSMVGVYQNGATLGTGVAFFKNAFETAFAPFYYATARQPDAREVFAKMATYGVAVFVLLVAGTTSVARDLILLLLKPDYLAALPVVPLIACAFAIQGVYQLTSIGLNLTSRTEFYPVSTIAAALVSVALGLWLIPAHGLVGAAVTVLLSYATQAIVAFVLAQRVYHVRYEHSRLARVIAAGVLASIAGLVLPSMPPLAGLAARGLTTVVVFVGVLWMSGFLRGSERAFVREVWTRVRRRRPLGPVRDAD
ncbi:MAG: lipopolysaccharide biosynthesis protein [Acidobacteriota bacterium]